jgi:hypothetical protein
MTYLNRRRAFRLDGTTEHSTKELLLNSEPSAPEVKLAERSRGVIIAQTLNTN